MLEKTWRRHNCRRMSQYFHILLRKIRRCPEPPLGGNAAVAGQIGQLSYNLKVRSHLPHPNERSPQSAALLGEPVSGHTARARLGIPRFALAAELTGVTLPGTTASDPFAIRG